MHLRTVVQRPCRRSLVSRIRDRIAGRGPSQTEANLDPNARPGLGGLQERLAFRMLAASMDDRIVIDPKICHGSTNLSHHSGVISGAAPAGRPIPAARGTV